MSSCKLIKVHMVISCEVDGHEMTGSSGSKVDMQRRTTSNSQKKTEDVGEHLVTPTAKIFPSVAVIQVGGVLQYKWEAYCNTSGRRTVIQMGGVLRVFPFPQARGHRKYCNISIQSGGILQCFIGKKWWLGVLTFYSSEVSNISNNTVEPSRKRYVCFLKNLISRFSSNRP